MNDLREQFADTTAHIQLRRWTRVLAWLWRRDIDPETLLTWTAILIMLAGFWTVVLWAAWKVLTHG